MNDAWSRACWCRPPSPESGRLPRGVSSAVKIVIPGGSGQVGTVLARAFHGDGTPGGGAQPVARRRALARRGGDARTLGEWARRKWTRGRRDQTWPAAA
jgi:hypothetical protein